MIYRIYCIRSNQTDNVYIGSTDQTLNQRFSVHKSFYKRWRNGNPKYISSYEILKYNDTWIELLEEDEANSKAEYESIEGIYQRNTDNCINKNRAGMNVKEDPQYNTRYGAQYRLKNKERESNRNKQYYQKNKDKFKQYRLKNKDKMRQYQEQYRQAKKLVAV